MAVENEFKESTVTTTNHTVNYDLPLWAGDDATSWLTQVNDAMNKIDSGIYEAKQSSHEVVTIAENAQKLAEETKAESDASAKIVEGYEGRLKTVEDTTAEHTTDLTNLSQRVDTQDTEIHSLQEVNKTLLTDIGTLQTGQESLTADIEELQTEITQVGRVLKKLGTVGVQGWTITSDSGKSTLNYSGIGANVFGNGIVEIFLTGDIKVIVNAQTPTITEIFSLKPLFSQIETKIRELYKNNNLTISAPFSSNTVIQANNTVASNVKATKGTMFMQFVGGTRALYLTPVLMFETATSDLIPGWQVGATYRINLPSINFHAYEEV